MSRGFHAEQMGLAQPSSGKDQRNAGFYSGSSGFDLFRRGNMEFVFSLPAGCQGDKSGPKSLVGIKYFLEFGRQRHFRCGIEIDFRS